MAISKPSVINYLRNIRFLQCVDYLMFLFNVFKNRKPNRLFFSEHPDFATPPLYLSYDAYNHTNWRTYYDTGLKHARLIAELINEYISENEIRICEWGCGPARVIRHLNKIDGFDKVEIFGTDYNEKSVRWCKKYINSIQFIKNDLDPPLSLEAELFDCVYAISIFTHLSEPAHYAWIKELFRLVKPKGILIFTTHGDICAKRLLPAEREKYESGCLVIKGHVKEGKKLFLAYQPPQFVKNKLLKDYVIVKHISNTAPYQFEQEVWCARKKC